MTPVLRINQLQKNYGDFVALNQVSYDVPKGSVFGLLGPNGSGKTTTLGIVLSILNQTSGTFSWFGNAPSAADRIRIGAILEHPNFYPYMSAEENLKIVAKIKGVPYDNIDKVLELVNLLERKKGSYKTFSLGMKQRLAIAAALINDPEVLVLDEPTNGLDPQGIAEVRELILKIAANGKTIIIASHMLDEIEKVCTHMAVLQHGKVLTHGKVDEIITRDPWVEVAGAEMDRINELLPSFDGYKSHTAYPNVHMVRLSDGFTSLHLNKWLFEQGIVLSHLLVRQKSLESFFLEITK